jgi:hypothetical protein
MTLVTLFIGILDDESKEKTPSVIVILCKHSSNEIPSSSSLVPRSAAWRSAAVVAATTDFDAVAEPTTF